MNNARRKRIAALIIRSVHQIQEAIAAAPVLEDLQSELESIQEEEQEAYDNMPSSLQESDRGQKAQSRLDNMESCKDQMLELYGALDTLDERSPPMQPDLRAECLAMAERGDTGALHPQEAAALLRRVADALEPKGDGVEAVTKGITVFLDAHRNDDEYTDGDIARAALSAAEPFIQARIREAVEADGWQDISTAPHNQSVLLGWRDWRDGRWCMEVNAATTGERLGNGYSNRSLHGSATHWRPLPAPPAIRQQPEEDGE